MDGTFFPKNDYRLYLCHHGIKGQKWGIKHGPPYPIGSSPRKVFISGTSKIKLKDSEYYRKSLPKEITSKIDSYMKDNNHILIGDAPGIDTEVQKYLAKKGYRNVTVYTISKDKPRSYWDDGHLGWGIKNVEGTEQVDKDKAMSKDAHTGFAVILEDGAKATRNNIKRMDDMGKDVDVFQLNRDGIDFFIEKSTPDAANDIYNTLSDLEKYQLFGPEKRKEYATPKPYRNKGSVKIQSALLRVKDTPVSVVDARIQTGKYNDSVNLSIMTRSGEQYRGHGYGSRAAQIVINNLLEDNPSINKIHWGALSTNTASRRTAEKLGFERSPSDDMIYDDNLWVEYVMNTKLKDI